MICGVVVLFLLLIFLLLLSGCSVFVIVVLLVVLLLLFCYCCCFVVVLVLLLFWLLLWLFCCCVISPEHQKKQHICKPLFSIVFAPLSFSLSFSFSFFLSFVPFFRSFLSFLSFRSSLAFLSFLPFLSLLSSFLFRPSFLFLPFLLLLGWCCCCYKGFICYCFCYNSCFCWCHDVCCFALVGGSLFVVVVCLCCYVVNCWVSKSPPNNINNLATFLFTFLGGHVARLLALQFHSIFLELCFFANISFSLQKEERCLRNKKGNETKVARLLTLQALKCGQVIDPTTHMLSLSMYIYTYIFIYMYLYRPSKSAVKLGSGPIFGFWKLGSGPIWELGYGPRWLQPIFIVVSDIFCKK